MGAKGSLATAVALLLVCEAVNAAPAGQIEEILVVGARMPRPVQDVVGTVDVITRNALLDAIALNAFDVVRYTPGISVAEASTRFGATEFTVRGLSGNRVTTLVDGVPVADQFDIGAFSNAGQDYIVPDTISRVEILRGPASTLFGSDALGGVVAIVTRDPEEYLDGRRSRLGASAAYSGADGGRQLTTSGAAQMGAVSGVLHASILDAGERDAAGTRNEDPLDRRRAAGMLKLFVPLRGGDAIRLKAEMFDEDVVSRPEAVMGYSRQFRNTTALRGDDERTRVALQVEYDFEVAADWAEGGRLNVYHQRSRTTQLTSERRDKLNPPQEIQRVFDYRHDDVGALLDLESRFEAGGFGHRLGWGLSVRRSTVEERRDGWLRSGIGGVPSRELLGEVMPVRDFPNTTIVETGLFVHDEIARGALTLIPALRVESYRLDARADALYRADNPTTAAEDVTEFALAPKLGLQWRAADGLDLFAQYARGFRAPPFEDVNIGLDIPMFNVRAVPNPDLEAETSDGVELGLRFTGSRHAVQLTLFGADYRNFIESKVALGPEPGTGVLLFQSLNIDRARVYGAEASFATPLAATVDLEMAAAWTRGEDRDSGQPLNTVDPAEFVTRLHWHPTARWAGSLSVTAVAAQSRVDERRADLFQPDGYAIVDLSARYLVRSDMRLSLGLFNVTDRQHWRWASVRGRPEGDPLIELMAAPARYAAVSLHVGL
jgi:hemoglobin/transferrin/lactoferrin receptor protein